jgi:hypothetical protein
MSKGVFFLPRNSYRLQRRFPRGVKQPQYETIAHIRSGSRRGMHLNVFSLLSIIKYSYNFIFSRDSVELFTDFHLVFTFFSI